MPVSTFKRFDLESAATERTRAESGNERIQKEESVQGKVVLVSCVQIGGALETLSTVQA